VLPGDLTYDQTVVFLEEIHPTPSKACQISIELSPESPKGSKLRIQGIAVTADPGHVAGRIGEEMYMGWLSGDTWRA
jgi:hypothetical protein